MISAALEPKRVNETAIITLPDWTRTVVPAYGTVLKSEISKINLAIHLARQNIIHGTGGPFGAAIFDLETHELLGVGVNRVVPNSSAANHAEVTAIMLTGQGHGTFNLSQIGSKNIGLYSSCEPCAMCMGATQWSGVKKLVFASPGSVAEEIGFDEGIKPKNGVYALKDAGIEVVQMAEAFGNRVLRSYGGTIYNGATRTTN